MTIRDPGLPGRAAEWKPDMLAFGSTTGFHRRYYEVVRSLKERMGNVPVVAGGAHATFFPGDFDDRDYLDYLVVGEADSAFPQLLEALEGRRPLAGVGNLRYRTPSGIVQNPLLPLVEDLDSIPFPRRDLVIGGKPSTADKAAFCIIGRGCPYSCTYCFNHSQKALYRGLGTYVRHRSVSNVLEELKQLRQNRPGMQMIVFQDDIFVLRHDWVMEFSERYPSEVGLPFHCHVRADLVTPEIAGALRRAGCLSVKMAIESASDTLRNEVLGRKMSIETIRGACAALKDAGIRMVTQNILCIPTGTWRDDLETLELNASVKPDFVFATLLQPYPGTEIARFCRERGFLDEKTGVPDTPDSFFHGSVLKVPDRRIRERLRMIFAIAVEFPLVRRLAPLLCRLPFGALYNLLDKVWKGYCIKMRIFPYRLTPGEFARDVISYFRSNYY